MIWGKLAHKMEKAMAPHSSTLAWKIPWTEEPGRLQSMGREESDTTERLHFHFSLSCIGEGNGSPPMIRVPAYWILVMLFLWASLVAQRLKRLPAMQET